MKNDKLKILLLSDAASFHTERFYEELQNQNCEVLLASIEEGIPEAVKLHKVSFVKQFHYRLAVTQIRSLIQTFQPDIVSAHFASGYGHIAALALRNSKIPLALNLWGSDILIVPKKSFFHRRKTKFALKNAQHVFADSQYLIDSAKEIYNFDKSTVISWGVEHSIFDLYKTEKKLSEPLKIIIPRSHEAVYNNLFIVQSLKKYIIEEKVQLTFPSFGSLFASFKDECEKIVGDKIKFYKKAKRQDFLKLASEHEVYLSASHSDSSPVSLIEAMALGLVPMVMQIEGVKEWVSGANGFMFDNNKDSICNTLEKIFNTSTDFSDMRESNKKRVLESALFEKNIAEQLTIFKSLVESTS